MTIRESGVDSVTIGKGEMEVSERERASARLPDGAHRAPSPSHPRGHVIPVKAGTYPMPAQPHKPSFRRRPESRRRGASPAPQNPADIPLDRHFIRF